MTISIDAIKELRDKTGAGMSDCKRALEETGGDSGKAMDVLRKTGIAKASKRSDREAQEGIISLAVNDDGNKGYMAMFASETDFVSRSEKFRDFAKDVFNLIVEMEPKTMDELFSLKMSDGNSVKDRLDALSGVFGEKLEIKKFDILASSGAVSSYSHGGGRIGVLVSVADSGAKEIAYEIAMHVAAANPKYISREEVPIAEIENETEIYREQLANEGKPENMIENIIKGKLNKYFQEIVLLEQEYIKDEKLKVKDFLKDVQVEKFIRYSF